MTESYCRRVPKANESVLRKLFEIKSGHSMIDNMKKLLLYSNI